MNVILDSMLRVQVDALKNRDVGKIAEDLTFTLRDVGADMGGASNRSDRTVELYRVTGRNLCLPRHYVPPFEITSIDDRMADGERAGFRFLWTLRTDDACRQDEAAEALFGCGDGILAAATGKGKTIIALAAAAALGRKTLVIVPTEFLMGQWAERALQCTSLNAGDIGRIQGDVMDWRKPLVIATVQTLSRRLLPPEVASSFGLVVTDEVHRMGAPEWIKSIEQFPARRRWGLSATVERKDGMHVAFQQHLGGVVYAMLDLEIVPKVFRVHTGVAVPAAEYTNRWNGRLNYARLYTVIAQHKARNALIVSEISKAYRSGRKILCLSKRLDHLDVIRHLLCSAGIPPDRVGMIRGSTPRPDRLRVLRECRVILGIEQIAGLGLDQPDLDTLFWLTPMQSVDQNVGRILRHCEGKKDPLVIDLVDAVPFFVKLAEARLRTYRSRGYEVVNVDMRGRAVSLQNHFV